MTHTAAGNNFKHFPFPPLRHKPPSSSNHFYKLIPVTPYELSGDLKVTEFQTDSFMSLFPHIFPPAAGDIDLYQVN